MITLAKLGGYLHRTCDGPPGFECLWRGYAVFDTMVQMMQLYHASASRTRKSMRHTKYMGQAQG